MLEPNTFPHQMPEEPWVINVAHLYTLLKRAKQRLGKKEDKIPHCSSFPHFFNPGQRSARVPTEGQDDFDTTSLSSFVSCHLESLLQQATGTFLVFKGMTLCLT